MLYAIHTVFCALLNLPQDNRIYCCLRGKCDIHKISKFVIQIWNSFCYYFHLKVFLDCSHSDCLGLSGWCGSRWGQTETLRYDTQTHANVYPRILLVNARATFILRISEVKGLNMKIVDCTGSFHNNQIC